MSSLDDELAEIESQNAYGAPTDYAPASSNKPSSPRSPTGTRATTGISIAPSAGTATTSSGVAKVKASQLNSVGRGRRGSGFKPDDAENEAGATPTGATGGKVPMSAYMNPNMTAQQQAALQAMLERNPGLAKYAPPGALGGPVSGAPRNGGPAPTSHRMGGCPPPTRKMGGDAAPPPPATTKMGAGGASGGRGADLLVGWGQEGDGEDESDEDVYAPPVSKKMGQPPPSAMRPGAAPRDAVGGMQPPAAELQNPSKQILQDADKRIGEGNNGEESDDEGGTSYRPTVDAMATGGEAERIMRKQHEMYDLQMPAHRTYVGGFAAAAYETAREYHYIQKAEEAEEASSSKARVQDRRPPPSI
jgi:hypothetical protein